jgi:hypothetical protein
VRLRATLAGGRQPLLPLEDLAEREGALAAINGDYHGLDGFLLGKTYSSLKTGWDADDLAAYLSSSPAPEEGAFWIDEAGEPHVGTLDLGGSLGFVASVTQGWNVATGQVTLVTDAAPGRHSTPGASCLPVERIDATHYRIAGPLGHAFEGSALVVRDDALPLVRDELSLGHVIALSVRKRVRVAIGTGPRLIENGVVCPRVCGPEALARWSRYPRTAVGFDADAVYLVATVQEPRRQVSFEDFAHALRALGCTDATNLDGGPSSGIYAEGRLLNAVPGFEGVINPVGSALVVESAPGLR